MKKIGIVFLVLSVLNLVVAFIAMANNAPSEATSMKFNAFILLAIIGSLLYYFGGKKQNSQKD